MNRLEISICIPVYNGGKYLRQTLQSVLSQTLSDYELLIIDDGSDDESEEIITEFAHKDSRIIYYKNNSKLGLVGNWNECIKKSHGQWVKFIFQDDVLESNCLERMIDAIKNTTEEIKVIFCERDFIFEDVDSDEKNTYIHQNAIWKMYPDKVQFNPRDLAKIITRFPLSNIFGEPSSFLIHRDVFQQIGLFDTSFHHICDFEYWLRAGFNLKLILVPEVLVHFRVHNQSTSSRNRNQKWVQLRYLERLRLFLKFNSDESYKALRKDLNAWPCNMFLNTRAAIYSRKARRAIFDNRVGKNISEKQDLNDFYKEFPEALSLSKTNFILLACRFICYRIILEMKWAMYGIFSK